MTSNQNGTACLSRYRVKDDGNLKSSLTTRELHRDRTVVRQLKRFSATFVEIFHLLKRTTRLDVRISYSAKIPAVCWERFESSSHLPPIFAAYVSVRGRTVNWEKVYRIWNLQICDTFTLHKPCCYQCSPAKFRMPINKTSAKQSTKQLCESWPPQNDPTVHAVSPQWRGEFTTSFLGLRNCTYASPRSRIQLCFKQKKPPTSWRPTEKAIFSHPTSNASFLYGPCPFTRWEWLQGFS